MRTYSSVGHSNDPRTSIGRKWSRTVPWCSAVRGVTWDGGSRGNATTLTRHQWCRQPALSERRKREICDANWMTADANPNDSRAVHMQYIRHPNIHTSPAGNSRHYIVNGFASRETAHHLSVHCWNYKTIIRRCLVHSSNILLCDRINFNQRLWPSNTIQIVSR